VVVSQDKPRLEDPCICRLMTRVLYRFVKVVYICGYFAANVLAANDDIGDNNVQVFAHSGAIGSRCAWWPLYGCPLAPSRRCRLLQPPPRTSTQGLCSACCCMRRFEFARLLQEDFDERVEFIPTAEFMSDRIQTGDVKYV